MKFVSTAFFSVTLAASLQIVSAADITGTITFKGTPPDEIPLNQMEDSQDCMAFHTNLPTTHHYVVGPKGEFGNVTVFLRDANGNEITGKSTGASAAPAVLDQLGCIYVPQILAIQTGQKLIVKNSDTCNHNVHDVPGPNSQNEMHNDLQIPGGADLTYTFAHSETFLKFQCDVHPWMFAWVSIFDNPYFCVSGTDGKFTIKNVPPGKYTIVAQHRKVGTQTQVIEVKDSGATADFTFEPLAK